jgi:hypothetical protein
MHHAKQTYGRVEELLKLFLILASEGDKLSASCPDRFNPRKKPQYPLDRKLDAVANREILPCREWNIDRPAHNLRFHQFK